MRVGVNLNIVSTDNIPTESSGRCGGLGLQADAPVKNTGKTKRIVKIKDKK